MGTDIILEKQHTAVIPKGVVESKLKASSYQMDIIAILLAEIGKATDKDENLEYSLSAEMFSNLKKDISQHEAAKVLRKYICGDLDSNDESMRHIGFEVWIDKENFRHYNWFEKIFYENGVATFYLTPDIKQFLVDFKKHDQMKIYAKLRYILPMRSRYSKRIYLMCREFIGSGTRFCDTDWDLFKEKLQIPSSYNYFKIKNNILESAKKEINELSDIEIDYSISETLDKGGQRPTAIKFTIKKKFDDAEETQTKQEVIEEAENKSVEDIEEQIKQLSALLEKKKAEQK